MNINFIEYEENNIYKDFKLILIYILFIFVIIKIIFQIKGKFLLKKDRLNVLKFKNSFVTSNIKFY